MQTTIDDTAVGNVYEVIAAVYKQALREARRGDEKAIDWLDCVRPDWRELETLRCKKGRRIESLVAPNARPSS